jgi:hypothetical protein
MVKLTSMVLTAALAAPPSLVWAHHSFSMFDQQKLTSVDGTVKELQWTNPHSWLQVVAADGKGGTEEWSLELGASVVLHRAGWKPRILQPGDKVKLTFNPLRDGTHGGRLISVVLPDGHTLRGQGDAPPPVAATSPSH